MWVGPKDGGLSEQRRQFKPFDVRNRAPHRNESKQLLREDFANIGVVDHLQCPPGSAPLSLRSRYRTSVVQTAGAAPAVPNRESLVERAGSLKDAVLKPASDVPSPPLLASSPGSDDDAHPRAIEDRLRNSAELIFQNRLKLASDFSGIARLEDLTFERVFSASQGLRNK